MFRVAMRGSIVVLALVLVAAGAGTVLCEMDCAAGGHAEAAFAITATASGVATSHCDGEQMDSARQDMPSPHGSSNGNTKHSAHLHPRIVATTTARIQISPKPTFSDFAVGSIVIGAAISARIEGSLRNYGSPPPISSPPVFSTGVLRI
jgi:hypothetical protein